VTSTADRCGDPQAQWPVHIDKWKEHSSHTVVYITLDTHD